MREAGSGTRYSTRRARAFPMKRGANLTGLLKKTKFGKQKWSLRSSAVPNIRRHNPKKWSFVSIKKTKRHAQKNEVFFATQSVQKMGLFSFLGGLKNEVLQCVWCLKNEVFQFEKGVSSNYPFVKIGVSTNDLSKKMGVSKRTPTLRCFLYTVYVRI